MTHRAIARTTDPHTSHAAAASVHSITRLQANVLALYHQLGNLTDDQLIDYYMQMVDAGDYPPASPSGIRTRRSELVTLGKLVDTGERGTTASGRQTIVWGLPPLVPAPRASS